MATRKRGRAEMEAETPAEEPSTLQKLRNMWQFANLAQYLNLFKGPLKLGNGIGIEVRARIRCAKKRIDIATVSPLTRT